MVNMPSAQADFVSSKTNQVRATRVKESPIEDKVNPDQNLRKLLLLKTLL